MNNTETIFVNVTEEEIRDSVERVTDPRKQFSFQFPFGSVVCTPGIGKLDADWHYYCQIGQTERRAQGYSYPDNCIAYDMYMETLIQELHSPTATVKVCTQDPLNGAWFPMGSEVPE